MVLRDGLASNNLLSSLYPFVANPGTINSVSLGLLDMQKASWALAILAGAAQYWQAKMTMAKKAPAQAGAGAKDENMMAMMNKQMIYMMPAMTVLIGFSLPAGLTLYWFFSTLLMGLQQLWLFKKAPNTPNTPNTPKIIEGEVVKK